VKEFQDPMHRAARLAEKDVVGQAAPLRFFGGCEQALVSEERGRPTDAGAFVQKPISACATTEMLGESSRSMLGKRKWLADSFTRLLGLPWGAFSFQPARCSSETKVKEQCSHSSRLVRCWWRAKENVRLDKKHNQPKKHDAEAAAASYRS
jgi:hypothetical protein